MMAAGLMGSNISTVLKLDLDDRPNIYLDVRRAMAKTKLLFRLESHKTANSRHSIVLLKISNHDEDICL